MITLSDRDTPFNGHTTKEINDAMRLAAARDGVSLSEWMSNVFEEKLEQIGLLGHMDEETKQAQAQHDQRVIDRLESELTRINRTLDALLRNRAAKEAAAAEQDEG